VHRTYLPPLHHHPYFTDLQLVDTEGNSPPAGADPAVRSQAMVNSEMLLSRLIGLPFHSFMTEADVESVVDFLAR
jgi:dTDP-4-amino-4,6-dideoxygalactose transaminase